MYAKVGATSTSIRLNKPSMQDSPNETAKIIKKSGLKTHLRELILNFLTQGRAHHFPGPHPCANSALQASLRLSQHFSNLPPPFSIPLYAPADRHYGKYERSRINK